MHKFLKSAAVLAFVAAAFGLNGCSKENDNGFQTSDDKEFKYKFIEDKEGTPVDSNSVVTIHVSSYVINEGKDSLLFSTYQQMKDGFMQKMPSKKMLQRFALEKAFFLMSPGDSLLAIFEADSVFKGQPEGMRPPMFGPNSQMKFAIKMVKAETMASIEKSKEQEIADYSKAKNKTYTRTNEGLYVMTQKEGTGYAAQDGDSVLVHYTGKIIPSEEVFDSSLPRKMPFPVIVGAGGVIRGWDIACKGAKAGQKMEIICPANLAYGDRATGPIPAYANLLFEMEITKVVPAKK